VLSCKSTDHPISHPCSFAREDEGSPRQDILIKMCPIDFASFKKCMQANGNDENRCLESKNILDKSSALAFKKVNAAPSDQWVY